MPALDVSPAVTVLLVDDDAELLRTLRDILEVKGYEVCTADRGRSALDLVDGMSAPPLVALVDLRLPDLPGLEVASTLHEQSPATQVVILTGDTSIDSAIDAIRNGSVDYLVKPVQPARLLETLERASERGRRHKAETALEHERKRKSDILDASPVGLAVLRLDGSLEYLNKAGAGLLDASVETYVKEYPASLLRAERWLAAAAEASQGRGDGDLDEFDRTFRGGDGKSRTLTLKVSPLRAPDGTVDATLEVFTDVTERRQLEERLRQAQKMEAVGRLAGGVSHDFNNLLTVILAQTDILLSETPEDSPWRADLETILSASKQAADVTRQLLSFSRAQISKAERLELNEIVREMRSLLARTLGANISVTDHLDDGLPSVEADAGKIRQVIMNLAINARDAMPDGGRLTFRTGRGSSGRRPVGALDTVDGAEEWVFLDVEDDGHGMDDATKMRVFEPFFTTKGEGHGTGLGLATVYGIVSQAGGFVDLDSEVGRGTRFRVWLPAGAERRAAERQSDEESGHSARACTVLVVDDEDVIRTALRRILVREGHMVLEASHGREALEVAKHHAEPIDLLLTDLQMPGLPPEEYVPHLLRRNPAMKVAIVSGSTSDPRPLSIPAVAGPTYSIQKPFAIRDVQKALREMLGEGP